jgi:hypothetical protein
MKHAREDYQDRIVDLAGKIPENEPVLLLRGQDSAAPFALRAYAGQAALDGASDDLVGKVLDQADKMEEWQRTQTSKTPDL